MISCLMIPICLGLNDTVTDTLESGWIINFLLEILKLLWSCIRIDKENLDYLFLN